MVKATPAEKLIRKKKAKSRASEEAAKVKKSKKGKRDKEPVAVGVVENVAEPVAGTSEKEVGFQLKAIDPVKRSKYKKNPECALARHTAQFCKSKQHYFENDKSHDGNALILPFISRTIDTQMHSRNQFGPFLGIAYSICDLMSTFKTPEDFRTLDGIYTGSEATGCKIGKIYEAKYDYRDKSQGSAFGKNHNGYRSLKNRINGICTGKDDLVRSLFSRFLVKLHDARTSTQSKEDRLRNLGPTIVEASKFHSGTQKPNVWLQRIKLPEEFSAFYPSARLEGIEDDNAEYMTDNEEGEECRNLNRTKKREAKVQSLAELKESKELLTQEIARNISSIKRDTEAIQERQKRVEKSKEELTNIEGLIAAMEHEIEELSMIKRRFGGSDGKGVQKWVAALDSVQSSVQEGGKFKLKSFLTTITPLMGMPRFELIQFDMEGLESLVQAGTTRQDRLSDSDVEDEAGQNDETNNKKVTQDDTTDELGDSRDELDPRGRTGRVSLSSSDNETEDQTTKDVASTDGGNNVVVEKSQMENAIEKPVEPMGDSLLSVNFMDVPNVFGTPFQEMAIVASEIDAEENTDPSGVLNTPKPSRKRPHSEILN